MFTKKDRYLLLAFVTIVISIYTTSASATPPEPPINITLPEASKLDTLRAIGEFIEVPYNMRVSRQFANVQIETTVLDTDGLGVRTVMQNRQSLEKIDQGVVRNIIIRIPLVRKPGEYRVEITAGQGSAVFDREVIYQIVTDDTVRLIRPADWRKEQSDRRRKQFEEEENKTGLKPSVDLLDPPLVKVPSNIAEKVQPLPVLRNSVIVDPAHGVGEDEEPYIVDESGKRWRDNDPVSINARILYEDFEGTFRPLVNATVRVYDDELIGSDFVGDTITDWNGEFSFSVNNDDGWLQNGRDLFFKVVATNSRFEVKDSWATEYRWKSDTIDDMDEGDNHDFGDLAIDDDEEAAQVFSFLNLGWNHITSVGGRDPGYIQARYPTTKSVDQFSGGKLRITSSSNRAPDIVLHEYGHALMDAAYPGGDPSPGGPHGFGDATQDSRLSWSEGWATAFMLSVCPDDQFNWDEGTTEGAGEWPDCTTQNDSGGQQIELFSSSTNRLGELQEGRVAAAMLDFMDSADDSNGTNDDLGRDDYSDANIGNEVLLDAIFNDVMWGSGHNDFLEFWDSLGGELFGTAEGPEAANIMLYNWMSEPAELPDVCVASKVAATEIVDGRDDTLKGLRLFRDQGLKPLTVGRKLIQNYYSHSPEMAMLLIKYPDVRKQVAEILRHFAELGKAAKSQVQLERMASNPVIPTQIRQNIEAMFELIEQNGSAELKRAANEVRKLYNQVQHLSVVDAVGVADNQQKADIDSTAIKPKDWAPGSKDVDWPTIWEAIPFAKEIPTLGSKE